MVTAYIGIGSNLGNRREHINNAIDLLNDTKGVNVARVSSIYETLPEGGPPQGKYLNGVIQIETDLEPLALLRKINIIELELGRVRTVNKGPRTIDLDILLYGDMNIRNDILSIPHPLMKGREFVLKGLCELAPELDICKKYYNGEDENN